jgi:hypothetical protein
LEKPVYRFCLKLEKTDLKRVLSYTNDGSTLLSREKYGGLYMVNQVTVEQEQNKTGEAFYEESPDNFESVDENRIAIQEAVEEHNNRGHVCDWDWD